MKTEKLINSINWLYYHLWFHIQYYDITPKNCDYIEHLKKEIIKQLNDFEKIKVG